MNEENSVMLIAGQSGAKSTFAGGFLHHVDKANGFVINSSVVGNTDDYENEVLNQMFSEGEYPNQTTDGYIAEYELEGKSFSRPGTTVNIIDLPGEFQRDILQRKGGLSLIQRINRGKTDDPADIRSDYKNNIKPDFDRGISPSTPDDWETTFLHHYYSSNRVIFLLNLYKIAEIDDKELVYGKDAIEHANEKFEDVAVVPIAVDWYGYDPEANDTGFIEGVLKQMINPSIRDSDLLEHLNNHLSLGSARKAKQILNYVESNGEIDLFSVSIPDDGAPANYTGKLTNDGQGGFEVKGFQEVIKWLEQ